MPVALLQPGVYIEEIPSGVRTITGVATSIALFVGWAAKGPTDRAGRLTSFPDYERIYGGLDRRTLLGHAVQQFFANGGADAYVLRLVAPAPAEGDPPPAIKPAAPASVTIDPLTIKASSPGAWANQYKVSVTRRPSPDDARFKLEVLQVIDSAHDVIVETFENLSVDPADSRFVPKVVNRRSTLIAVDEPANTNAPATTAATPLKDGEDGPVLEPDSPDFNAQLLANFGTGSVTDRIDLFNLLCVPGETNPDTLNKLQKECHDRRAFLIVDPEQDAKVDDFLTGADGQLTGSDSLNSAIFFPWVRCPDPLYRGALREFPPSGIVAGVFARTDLTRGVWKAPAGTEASLNGVAELTTNLSDAQNGLINPQAINCLRNLPPYGNVVWGSRTLQGQNDRGSEWKYVPVRRLALFLEESLYRGTQWVVFEPNDEPLWAQIRLNVGAFMNNLFRQGAFQGRTPREAYFVKVDRETTTQADIDAGVVNVHVGFAPLKPAEFVVLKIQQIAGELAT